MTYLTKKFVGTFDTTQFELTGNKFEKLDCHNRTLLFRAKRVKRTNALV